MSATPSVVRVELCAEGVAEATFADRLGADRIELCAGMVEDGTTPSIGTVRTTLAATRGLAVQVMIRPRGGNFVHSAAELDVMVADIELISELSVGHPSSVGFVFGALTPDHTIDRSAVRALTDACGDAPTTFHKAFDELPDQEHGLETLIDLGITYVLTSGGAATAVAGAASIRRLVELAGDRIGVIAAGSIGAESLETVLATGVRDVHLRAARWQDAAAVVQQVAALRGGR